MSWFDPSPPRKNKKKHQQRRQKKGNYKNTTNDKNHLFFQKALEEKFPWNVFPIIPKHSNATKPSGFPRFRCLTAMVPGSVVTARTCETLKVGGKHVPTKRSPTREAWRPSVLDLPPRGPGCNRGKGFSLGFPGLKMECHAGDWYFEWGLIQSMPGDSSRDLLIITVTYIII